MNSSGDSSSNHRSSSSRRINIRSSTSGNSSHNYSETNNNSYHHNSSSRHNKSGSYARRLDVNLLAQGMSGRFLGARIPRLQPLSNEELNKDLRLMNAYSDACVAYAQRFFAFCNSVNLALYEGGEHYTKPMVEGGNSNLGSSDGNSVFGANGGSSLLLPGSTATTVVGPNGQLTPSFTMPVKIDPEEEKRMAILRKKIYANEAQREVLETQYASLQKHHMYEVRRLRKTKEMYAGEMEFLKNLVKARSKVLALRRLRCAMIRDIHLCLTHRNSSSDGNNSAMQTEDSLLADEKMDHVLLSYWEEIEQELLQAEKACRNIAVPSGLDISSSGDFLGSSSPSKTSNNDANKRSKSPIRDRDNENSSLTFRKRPKLPKKERDSSFGSRNHDMNSSKNNDSSNSQGDTILIPWNSQLEPATPHGVPIMLSNLSVAPDRSIGAGKCVPHTSYILVYIMYRSQYSFVIDILCFTGLSFNKNKTTFIESNLPNSYNDEMIDDENELENIKLEIEALVAHLHQEQKVNNELHLDIVNTRKRSDEMCVTMSLLRNETEAVLQRHNIILSTEEARARAAELHGSDKSSGQKENDANNNDDNATTNENGGGEESEDDSEEEEDEERSLTVAPPEITIHVKGETEGLEEDEGLDADPQTDSDDEEGEIKEEESNDGVPPQTQEEDEEEETDSNLDAPATDGPANNTEQGEETDSTEEGEIQEEDSEVEPAQQPLAEVIVARDENTDTSTNAVTSKSSQDPSKDNTEISANGASAQTATQQRKRGFDLSNSSSTTMGNRTFASATATKISSSTAAQSQVGNGKGDTHEGESGSKRRRI